MTRAHADWEAMPPKENDALTEAQRAYLHTWIAAGAPWPDAARTRELLAQNDRWSAEDGITVPTSGGLSDDWTRRRYKPEDVWAIRPLRRPVVPAAAPNPIDAFLNQALTAAQLRPAPAAECPHVHSPRDL